MPHIQRGEYPPNWKEIATQIKDGANWRCERCDHAHDVPAGYMLTVHHLDGNKSNCDWWNLPALCQRCHLTIQAKVVMERVWMFPHSEWFRPYVAGYYASIQGYPTDREYVFENMNELLAHGGPRELVFNHDNDLRKHETD